MCENFWYATLIWYMMSFEIYCRDLFILGVIGFREKWVSVLLLDTYIQESFCSVSCSLSKLLIHIIFFWLFQFLHSSFTLLEDRTDWLQLWDWKLGVLATAGDAGGVVLCALWEPVADGGSSEIFGLCFLVFFFTFFSSAASRLIRLELICIVYESAIPECNRIYSKV